MCERQKNRPNSLIISRLGNRGSVPPSALLGLNVKMIEVILIGFEHLSEMTKNTGILLTKWIRKIMHRLIHHEHNLAEWAAFAQEKKIRPFFLVFYVFVMWIHPLKKGSFPYKQITFLTLCLSQSWDSRGLFQMDLFIIRLIWVKSCKGRLLGPASLASLEERGIETSTCQRHLRAAFTSLSPGYCFDSDLFKLQIPQEMFIYYI